MKIKVNEEGYVESYCTLGDMPSSFEFEGDIPEGFGPETCGAYRFDSITGSLLLDAERAIARSQAAARAERLPELLALLSGTDYKIIKCYEAALVGEALPYDAQELRRTRQEWRDEINRIQEISKAGI
jgi:hypothetical protein